MLLKLPPEAVRLRRLARALGAGEVSEAEYRRARREIIDAFTAVPADAKGAERGFGDTTLRRGDAPRAGAGTAAGGTRPGVVTTSGARRRWWWLLVLALVLTAALLTVPLAR